MVLLRHGRTAWNHAHRVQGQADVELDDTGHLQAAAAAPAIAAYRPEVLWSSDLARARQTAAYVAKETGLEPVHDARLREFFLGERQGLTHEEYAALAPEEFAAFRAGDLSVARGAESARAVVDRLSEALHELLGQVAPGGTGVAVAHGAAIRVATLGLLGLPDSALGAFRAVGNCHWVVLENHTGIIRLAGYNLGVAEPVPSAP
nr:histidine phosphatase family protein [Nocardioides sp. zg-DK7169]